MDSIFQVCVSTETPGENGIFGGGVASFRAEKLGSVVHCLWHIPQRSPKRSRSNRYPTPAQCEQKLTLNQPRTHFVQSLHKSIRIYMGVKILGANTLYINFCLFKQLPMVSKGLINGQSQVGTKIYYIIIIVNFCINLKTLDTIIM